MYSKYFFQGDGRLAFDSVWFSSSCDETDKKIKLAQDILVFEAEL